MNKYKEIDAAKCLLELPEQATLADIKKNYRMLLNRWHPDKCKEDTTTCKDMTRKIIAAYRVIMNYCDNYCYSFTKEEIKRQTASEMWWFEQFGEDPVWGNRQ